MQQKDDRICQLEKELSNAKSAVNTVVAQNQHAEDVIRAMSQKLKEVWNFVLVYLCFQILGKEKTEGKGHKNWT